MCRSSQGFSVAMTVATFEFDVRVGDIEPARDVVPPPHRAAGQMIFSTFARRRRCVPGCAVGQADGHEERALILVRQKSPGQIIKRPPSARKTPQATARKRNADRVLTPDRYSGSWSTRSRD